MKKFLTVLTLALTALLALPQAAHADTEMLEEFAAALDAEMAPDGSCEFNGKDLVLTVNEDVSAEDAELIGLFASSTEAQEYVVQEFVKSIDAEIRQMLAYVLSESGANVIFRLKLPDGTTPEFLITPEQLLGE